MRIVRNIGIIFTVSVLILATGGISIYHHVCHCADQMTSSLFLEAECDHNEHNATYCHAEEKKSCCTNESGSKDKHGCEDKDCCQNSIQFLKIHDSFQPGIEKLNLKPCVVALAMVYVDISEDTFVNQSLHFFKTDLPPPDTGRQIVVSLHQLKLDTHLV